MKQTLWWPSATALTMALLVTIVGIACGSDPADDPTPSPTPHATSTPAPEPAFSDTRPSELPAWVPEELWNAPVLELKFPPGVNAFTGWDGEGVFMIPESIQPGSPAWDLRQEGLLACDMPTTAFPDYLWQGDGSAVSYALLDSYWIDFVSPTGYEYYECTFDVSKPTRVRLVDGRQDDDEIINREVLVAPLPSIPVRSPGLVPDGPCHHGIQWEGFDSSFVRGGGELLPSGLIKVSCLYKSVPSDEPLDLGGVG